MKNLISGGRKLIMANRTFVMGDPHGAHIPLQQCLERSGFDKENDLLITLGDICDGWPFVYECVEILLSIKNRIDIIGNHDEWFHKWLKSGMHPDYWDQGGFGTARSYLRAAGKDEFDYHEKWAWSASGRRKRIFHIPIEFEDIPPAHREFFYNQQLYYKDAQNKLFVHGGFIRSLTLAENKERKVDDLYFYWNRELWDQALSVSDGQKLKFKENLTEIFIGHTATIHWTQFKKVPGSHVLIPYANDDCPPMHADIIWNIDTGAGSKGKLTIMDVDTHEYWQSDKVNDIYGEYKPMG